MKPFKKKASQYINELTENKPTFIMLIYSNLEFFIADICSMKNILFPTHEFIITKNQKIIKKLISKKIYFISLKTHKDILIVSAFFRNNSW